MVEKNKYKIGALKLSNLKTDCKIEQLRNYGTCKRLHNTMKHVRDQN